MLDAGTSNPSEDQLCPASNRCTDAQAFYDADEQLFGQVLNPTGVMAYRPPILAAARGLGRSVAKDGVLPPGIRVLVCVRVAMLVSCPF